MYQIYANGSIIFDDTTPLPSLKLLEPKLTLEENNAGKLVIKLPPENVGYNSIECMTTELVVKQDGNEIWRGRVISEEVDFWNCKKYTAEGELAYLNDTIQLPARYNVSNTTISSFLRTLLENHNAQITNDGIDKHFTVNAAGPAITVDDGDSLDDSNAINRYTNYESTLKCISEKLIDRLGGHLRIRHEGDNIRYLDYLKDYNEIGACDQEIRFGSNLLDYVSNLESVEWVTAICPRGKRLEISEEDQPITGLEAYTNVSTADADGDWHASGSMFVKNKTMCDRFGFISAVVDWDEVTDVNVLKNKAKEYLQKVVFDQFCLEISAVDLHYLNPSVESFKLQETVHCIADPYGMDAIFPVTKVDIDLNNPANTKYTLGTKVTPSLTSAQNRANNAASNYMDDTFIPTESIVLDNAKADATELINGSAQGGFASFIYGIDASGNAVIDQNAESPMKPTGLRVANAQKDENATNRWLWTTGGLGHYSRSGNPLPAWNTVNVNTAITMDGKIVADFITAGMLKLTGATTQSSSKETGKNVSAFMAVYDGSTKVGHWGSNGIWIGKGSITLGTRGSAITYKAADGTNRTGYYPVEINNDGSALFRYATMTTGSTIGKAVIDSDGVIGNYGTQNKMSSMEIGDGTFGISVNSRFSSSSWGGIAFGYEAYRKCHFGNTSFVLWDANEESDGLAQGGFFVIRGAPSQGDTGNYTKQVFNAFHIVKYGSTAATFDEGFYNLVMDMKDVMEDHGWL